MEGGTGSRLVSVDDISSDNSSDKDYSPEDEPPQKPKHYKQAKFAKVAAPGNSSANLVLSSSTIVGASSHPAWVTTLLACNAYGFVSKRTVGSNQSRTSYTLECLLCKEAGTEKTITDRQKKNFVGHTKVRNK